MTDRTSAGRTSISAAEARRIALVAQGFGSSRPDIAAGDRAFTEVINNQGLLQLDFVNVLVPAHYLVMYSRLGPFDRGRFERHVYGSGQFTEQWAHEASIVPADTWPLLEHRRKAWTPWKRHPVLKLDDKERYLEEVLDAVREQGGLTASDLPSVPRPKGRPGDWQRSIPRWALEWHFSQGGVTVADRLPNFQRVYDLPERVIPEEHLECGHSPEAAQRELIRRAARSFGVATAADLADYYRMRPADARPRIEELVEAGELTPAEVEGWKEAAYLAPSADCPGEITGASLLSPFDPVVWFRPRAERMFDFHYRIEIYVPAAKRRWGYYVLPFRLGDRIVARVDLKADRPAARLLVQKLHLEDGATITECAAPLAQQLDELADWLGLDRVVVRPRHPFAKALRAAIKGRT